MQDNYAWLLVNQKTGETAVVDTPDAKPISAYLENRGLKLDYILNTHHHWDHTGGNVDLKEKYKSRVVGPRADRDRIPAIDVELGDGDSWQFGGLEMKVLDTPGHTRGHITLYFPEPGAVFTGDTLFAMGCGRLFEGSPEQMWTSLSKIAALPPSTQVFCGHEYTASNAKFAAFVDPDNAVLAARKEAVDDLRSQGLATLPCSLEEELKTNPFLRPHDSAIRKKLGIPADASDAHALGVIRRAKDSF
eukprot:jgi/Botrbrau1/20079/Bobra.200_1s0082.1